MKNYEEMAQDVFRRMDEYEAKKKRRRTIIAKTTAVACPACVALIAAVGIWQGGLLKPPTRDNGAPINADIPATEPTEESPVAVAGDWDEHEEIVDAPTEAEPQVTEDEPPLQPQEEEPSQSADEPMTDADAPAADPGFASISDCLGYAYIDGELYMQDWGDDLTEYTLGEYIGEGSDFEGIYQYGIGSHFYRAAESVDVILVKLDNGGQVTLVKTAIPDDEHLTYGFENNLFCF